MFSEAKPCPLCSHDKTYKHGKTSKGSQRYRCPNCKQTFTDTFDTVYYRRQVSQEEIRIVLQSHCEGTSLRPQAVAAKLSAVRRQKSLRPPEVASGFACGRSNLLIRMPSLPTLRWSFVEKNIHHCLPEELEAGDCWIALSLAQLNGLILCGRVGKRTDKLAIELVASTEGRTDCKEWHTDGWSGYERVLCKDDAAEHYIGKILTQRLERTNGSLRQQTGRWQRRQNMRDWRGNPSSANSRKFGKVWEQTKVTLRLVISYFN